MTQNFQAIRGMPDILPVMLPYWHHVEKELKNVVASYAYKEIRFPILEHTELFSRTIGEVTDIVEKEMYTFSDRNGDSLTLRPEGTAGCVRAGIQHGLLYNQIQRLWYMGPMFRHERPQKGRFRQFHQFGVETFGLSGPDLDAELIFMAARFWDRLGILDKVTLHINSLGSLDARQRYQKELVAYFEKNQGSLDADSKRRLTSNPMRILDSKNPEMKGLIENAPILLDYLDEDAAAHFTELKKLLDMAEVKYKVDTHLVRGLDYYCLTVFEWITEELGAQGAICAGGRYDGLVAELGGKQVPAAGFAIGLERLVELVASCNKVDEVADAYLVMVGQEAMSEGLMLAEEIRTEIPNLSLLVNCGSGSFKSQFKRADKSGAKVAIVLGEEELAQKNVSLKYLREDHPQLKLPKTELIENLKKLCLGG